MDTFSPNKRIEDSPDIKWRRFNSVTASAVLDRASCNCGECAAERNRASGILADNPNQYKT